MDRSKTSERLLVNSALNLYRMEGEALYDAKHEAENNIFRDGFPPFSFSLSLGEFHQQLAEVFQSDFHSFEVLANLSLLTHKKIDDYLEKLYDKAHLERMQVSYTLSKIMPLDREKIEKLVIVNPYT